MSFWHCLCKIQAAVANFQGSPEDKPTVYLVRYILCASNPIIHPERSACFGRCGLCGPKQMVTVLFGLMHSTEVPSGWSASQNIFCHLYETTLLLFADQSGVKTEAVIFLSLNCMLCSVFVWTPSWTPRYEPPWWLAFLSLPVFHFPLF